MPAPKSYSLPVYVQSDIGIGLALVYIPAVVFATAATEDCLLEAEAPDVKARLEAAYDKVRHPYDILDNMTPEERLLAEQWAEKVARKIDHKYDMWLEPFLRRAD